MNDIGALIGKFSVGIISDATYGKRSPAIVITITGTCLIFYLLTYEYLDLDYVTCLICFFFLGIFMSGADSTISMTCAADIGKDKADKKTKAVATVTGIMSGTGNVGASVGQFTVGETVDAWGWRNGYLLFVAVLQTFTLLPLMRVVVRECKEIKVIRRERKMKKLAET